MKVKVCFGQGLFCIIAWDEKCTFHQYNNFRGSSLSRLS